MVIRYRINKKRGSAGVDPFLFVTFPSELVYSVMRTLLILCFFIQNIDLISQDRCYYNDAANAIFFYENNVLNKIVKIENYVGFRTTTTTYDEKGNISSLCTQDCTGLVVTYYEWSSNGKIRFTETYSDSEKTEITYDSVSGQIISQGQYRLTKYDTSISIFRSENLGDHSSWCKQGCLVPYGTWYTFHSNGTIESQGMYLPLNMMTMDTVLAEDPMHEQTYVLVVLASPTKIRDGKWLYFNESGNLIREEFYYNGILQTTSEY